jgi:rubrerythrin
MSLREAANAAFAPVRDTEKHIFTDRVKRAERHFREQFKQEVKANVDAEKQTIDFAVDELRLRYVGHERYGSKPFTGPGWNVIEECAGCGKSYAIRHVGTLAQLGRYLHDDPDWECPICKNETAVSKRKRKAKATA